MASDGRYYPTNGNLYCNRLVQEDVDDSTPVTAQELLTRFWLNGYLCSPYVAV